MSQITFQAKVKPRAVRFRGTCLKSREDKTVPHLTGPVVHYSIEYSIVPSQMVALAPAVSHLVSAIAYDADGKMLNSDFGTFPVPLEVKVYGGAAGRAVRAGMRSASGKGLSASGCPRPDNGQTGAFEIPLEVNTDARAAKIVEGPSAA